METNLFFRKLNKFTRNFTDIKFTSNERIFSLLHFKPKIILIDFAP